MGILIKILIVLVISVVLFIFYGLAKSASDADDYNDQAFKKYLEGLTVTSGCPVKNSPVD